MLKPVSEAGLLERQAAFMDMGLRADALHHVSQFQSHRAELPGWNASVWVERAGIMGTAGAHRKFE
jgi:hypothetical protein